MIITYDDTQSIILILSAPTLHAGKNFSKFFNEKSLVSRRIRVRSSIFLKFRKIFSGLLYAD